MNEALEAGVGDMFEKKLDSQLGGVTVEDIGRSLIDPFFNFLLLTSTRPSSLLSQSTVRGSHQIDICPQFIFANSQ